MGRLDATDEELTYHVVDDRRAIRSPWGRGNSKIGQGIYTYSRLPGKHGTCPGATELCEEVCYSKRMEGNKPLWDWMTENTHQPGPPDLPRDAKIVRIHVSGDFDTPGYILTWIGLCDFYSSVLFFAYTRSWRVPELLPFLETLESLSNVQLFASMDESTKESPPAGWRIAWLRDSINLEGYENISLCPEEAGTKPNCEVCGYCFRGKRGDVVFPIHEGVA